MAKKCLKEVPHHVLFSGVRFQELNILFCFFGLLLCNLNTGELFLNKTKVLTALHDYADEILLGPFVSLKVPRVYA